MGAGNLRVNCFEFRISSNFPKCHVTLTTLKGVDAILRLGNTPAFLQKFWGNEGRIIMAKLLSCFSKLRTPFKKASRGAVAVEMALIAPALFLILIGTMESALMFGAQQLLENAAYNTSRLAKTGFITSGQTQAQTVSQILTTELQSYGTLINTANVTMTESDYNSFSSAAQGGGTSGYGTQQQIVVYTITYPWKLFTPMMSAIIGTNGIVNLTSTIVVRNEPYG